MPVINSLLNLVFPPVCLGCNKISKIICKNCLKQFQETSQFICPTCLKISPNGWLHKDCKGPIDGLTAVWQYDQKVKKVIKEIKYRYYFSAMPDLVKYFIFYLSFPKYQNLRDFLELKPIMIPVPLHPKRQKIRGFNQAALLGKALAYYWHLAYSEKILIRQEYTTPQSQLTKKERQANIKRAFSVTKQILKLGKRPLKDRYILLVDDIWTTGITMRTCARTLKLLGAEKIWALTLAR